MKIKSILQKTKVQKLNQSPTKKKIVDLKMFHMANLFHTDISDADNPEVIVISLLSLNKLKRHFQNIPYFF